MKAKLPNLIGTAVLGLALVSNSLPAWAGSRTTQEVEISGSIAKGAVADVRFSSDSQQYIGCTFSKSSSSSGSSSFVTCVATDKTGRSLVRSINDPNAPSVVKAISDNSLITFGTLTGRPYCGYLEVENSSEHLR
jgi:hypothetical protein